MNKFFSLGGRANISFQKIQVRNLLFRIEDTVNHPYQDKDTRGIEITKLRSLEEMKGRKAQKKINTCDQSKGKQFWKKVFNNTT